MSDGKPKISNLSQGVIECPNCSELSGLSDMKELDVHECLSCKTPYFVPKKLKHYWLYRPLGGGGMGSVYKAISETEPGEFAIKILPRKKKADKELIDTLMLEGRVGKILGKSPHIVEVVDYGVEGDENFMASRFVEGTRLDIFVSSASRLSERQAIDIFTQILEAEIHIKNCGYLFRDMKPENIIIVEETMTAKLFDFGLIMSIEQAANPDPNDNIEGSPYYLPPERIVAAPEGEYSEVYSLGMLLFYMLAGTNYFSEADVKDLVTKHVRSLRVASVSSRLKDCSPMIVDVLDKMIKRDPNLRYHTLAEMADIFEEVSKEADGYPLNSGGLPTGFAGMNSGIAPSGEPAKVRKPLNLKPVFITLGVMAFLGVLAGGGWLYYNKTEQDKLRKMIIERTAARLDIPVDVEAPLLSEQEIRNLIDSKAQKIYIEELSYIRNFNEQFEKAKICKELGIDISGLVTNQIPLNEVKSMAKKALNTKIEKELELIKQEFPREKVEKEIAEELGVQLPLPRLVVDRKEIIKLARQKAAKQADSKYPPKRLSTRSAEIVDKYRCFKVGDVVTVPARSGQKITGTYQGISGRHILVGGKDILLADLPVSLTLKFDQTLSDKKATESIKILTADFEHKKAEYEKSVYEKELETLYKENHYVKQEGKWSYASSIINSRLMAQQKDFEKKQRSGEEEIIKAVKHSFNHNEFLKKYGYRLINKRWVSDQQLVGRKLKKKNDEFLAKKNKKLKDLKKEARISAELQVYEDNGYIYRDRKWQPAKQLLDDEVNKACKMEAGI